MISRHIGPSPCLRPLVLSVSEPESEGGVAHTGMDLGGLESNCNPRAPLSSRPTRSPESRFLCTFVGWTRREFDISSWRAEGLGGAVVRGRWREDAEMGVGVEWEWECEYCLLVLPCPITWNFAFASSIDDQPRAHMPASPPLALRAHPVLTVLE
jgi:hypothetical protein